MRLPPTAVFYLCGKELWELPCPSPPALENQDVAFQGLNTWHSFQYRVHGMHGSATGRPLRCPRLGPVRRRNRLGCRLRRALPRPARPRAPDRRLAGRCDAAAHFLNSRRPDSVESGKFFLRIDSAITPVPSHPVRQPGATTRGRVVAVAFPHRDKPYCRCGTIAAQLYERHRAVSLGQNWKSKN